MRSYLLGAFAIALLTGLALWFINSDDPEVTSTEQVAAGPEEKAVKLLLPDDEDDAVVAPGETPKTGELTVAVSSVGKPVAGAFVRLYSVDWPEGASEGVYKLTTEGTTADDGRVKLTGPRGKYTAVIRASGLPQASRNARLREKPEELLVDLVPGGTLKGRFLSGTSKTAVPNVTFRIEASQDSNGDRLAMAPPEERLLFDADAQGKFEAGPLEAGVHQLIVETPGFAKSQVQFGIPRAEELVVRLFQSATIEGVVVDEGGARVPQAKVVAGGQRNFQPANATSDAEGKFKLEVNPGPIWLSASAGDSSMASEFPLVVGPGAAVKDVKLVLEAGGAFEGTVTGLGAPVAEADVRLATDTNAAAFTAKSDAQGKWSFKGLSPGTYHLWLEAKGYVSARRRDLAIISGQTRRVDVKLDPAGRIEGTVVDANGVPVRDVRVTGNGTAMLLFPGVDTTDAEGKFALKSLMPGEWELTARGKAGGSAKAKVTVTAGEIATTQLKLNATGRIIGKVRTADGKVPLELLSISARPKSAADSSMRPGAMRAEFMSSVRDQVKADGSYELHAPAGDYLVNLSSRERFRFGRNDLNQKDVTVVEGETKELDFEWKEEEALEEMLAGVVVDARGAPAAGARVAVSEGKRRLFDGIETSEDGRFTIGVPAEEPKGKLYVEARFGGMRGSLENVSPGEKNLRIVLTDSGVIEGRVQSTRVVEEFKLTARPGPGGRGTEEVTCAGERFQLRNLAAGSIEVSVATTDGRAGRGTFTVEAGKVTEVVIEVKESASVKGRVSAKDMAAAMGFVSLRLVRTGNQRDAVTTRAEADGTFLFQGLASGDFELVVYTPKRWERRVAVPETGVVDVGELDLSRTAPGQIGVEYSFDHDGVVVTALDKDGPASVAGVQVGDIILAADGQPVKGKVGREALRGAPGSAVQLTLKRGEADSTVTVIRAK